MILDTWHITPRDDAIAHEQKDDVCICGPYVQYFQDAKVVVHFPIDGRRWRNPREQAQQVAATKGLEEL